MLVWNAIPSIMPMISVTLRDDSLIPSIVSVTRDTTVPPRVTVSSAPCARRLACFALSAFCFTVADSCSMLAAVC